MRGISVLFSLQASSKPDNQKGRTILNPVKRSYAAFWAGCFLIFAPVAAQMGQPVAAKVENAVASLDITDEIQGQKTFQVSRMIVKAKAEQVYRLLTDYENAPNVFPHLLKCHVIEDHGSVKVVQHRIHPSGPFGTYEYILQLKETPSKSLEWHRISGDFKEVDGFWKLEPIEGGRSTMVTYSSHINGGFFIPQAMIKRQVHQDMPEVMTALKTQAETGTQIAGRPVANRHN